MLKLKRKGALPSLAQKFVKETTGGDIVENRGQVESAKENGNLSEANGTKENKLKQRLILNKKKEKPKTILGHSSQDFKDIAGINLLVATIITTVTFAAAFTMPGGYNEKGLAISGQETAFKAFLFGNSLAFGCAAALMFIHFFLATRPRRQPYLYPIQLVSNLTMVSLLGMIVAFLSGILVVLPRKSGIFNLLLSSVLISFFIPCIYLSIKNIIYNVYYKSRKITFPSNDF